MARPRILTDEEREENRKNLDLCVIKFYVPKRLKDSIDDFSKQYTSRSKAVIDLIKTNPEYKKFRQSQIKNQTN